MKQIREMNDSIDIGVMSVLPRPRENGEYEKMRLRVNERVCEEVHKMQNEIDSKGRVHFVDVEQELNASMFEKDGVHMNREGNWKVGKRVIQWLAYCAAKQPRERKE